MGSYNIAITFAVGWLTCATAFAGDGCDPGFANQFQQAERVVDSLRPDKPGQARVFATDGSEFTAGQSRWMKGQLRLIEQACARGDRAEATRLLAAVQELLKTHQRAS
jgi:hypothetical protein